MNANFKNIILPLFVIVFLNLLGHGFYLISIERPVLYYEYLLIPLIFAFTSNKTVRYLIIGFIIISDAIISLSLFYFFDTFNYLTKLPSFFILDKAVGVVCIVGYNYLYNY